MKLIIVEFSIIFPKLMHRIAIHCFVTLYFFRVFVSGAVKSPFGSAKKIQLMELCGDLGSSCLSFFCAVAGLQPVVGG